MAEKREVAGPRDWMQCAPGVIMYKIKILLMLPFLIVPIGFDINAQEKIVEGHSKNIRPINHGVELTEGFGILTGLSPNSRVTKPVTGKRAGKLGLAITSTVAGTSVNWSTTLTQVATNSSHSFLSSVPQGQTGPPSFISHSTISVSAPTGSLGSPIVDHRIVVSSDAVPGTYQFVVEYSFWSGLTFIGLEWISFNVLIRESATDISESSIDFGDVSVGNTTRRSLIITNRIIRTLSIIPSTQAQGVIIDADDRAFSLGFGDSREINVSFTPSRSTSLNSILRIDIDGVEVSRFYEIPLTGRGIAPNISVSSTSLDFGEVQIGESSFQTFTITNPGGAQLLITSITTSNSQFIISREEFSSSWVVTVRFAPSSTGRKAGIVTITSNDPDQGSVIVSVAGTGTALPLPDISLSSTNLTFGSVDVGLSSSQALVVTNRGNADLIINSVSSSDGQFVLSSSSTFTVSGGGSQEVRIRFLPTSAGEKAAVLRLSSNDPDEESLAVSMTGVGVQTNRNPFATEDTVSVEMNGRINIPVLSNDSDPDGDPLSVSNISGSSKARLLVVNTDQTIHYRPNLEFAGVDTFSYTVSDGRGGEAKGTVIISVKSLVLLPVFSVSNNLVLFDQVTIGQMSSFTLTIANLGNSDLNIDSIKTLDPQFNVSDTFLVVATGGQKPLTVIFNPDVLGDHNSSLTFSTNDPDQSKVIINLKGTSIADEFSPQMSVSSKDVNFGSIVAGQTGQQTLIVSNIGQQPLTISNIISSSNLFTVSPSSFTLPPGGSQNITLIFQPTGTGDESSIITIKSDDPANQNVEINLAGMGESPTLNLTEEIPGPILIDLNPMDGNQNLKKTKGSTAGKRATLQLFAEGFPEVTGFGFTINFETERLDYVNKSFIIGNFIVGATPLIVDKGGILEAGAASLSGNSGKGSGFLCQLDFEAKEAFGDSTYLIITSLGLSLKDGTIRDEVINIIGWLSSSNEDRLNGDFDRNGSIGFRDFLLFAQAFGSENPDFDLDGDGSVGFKDFLIFAQIFANASVKTLKNPDDMR